MAPAKQVFRPESGYRIARADREIEELISSLGQAIESGRSRFRGLTMEEGMRDFFEWLTGASDEYPYPPT